MQAAFGMCSSIEKVSVVQQGVSIGSSVPMLGTSVLEQEGLYRIYYGTPEKVVKKRLIDVCEKEKKPIYRATLVDPLTARSMDESAGEVLITHRQISSEFEKELALQKAGCSETVVVVEALLLLEEEFNIEFVSLGGLARYRDAVSFLVKDVEGEERRSFARFCQGLWRTLTKYGQGEMTQEQAKVETILSAGVELFNAVGEEVGGRIENSEGLKGVALFSRNNLRAWATLHTERQHRHKLSHPFNFIGSDVETAVAAFAVLEFAAKKEEHEDLAPLLKAAIPFVRNVIANQGRRVLDEKKRRVIDASKVDEAIAKLKFGI